MAELARLLDRAELDALEGPHGKMTTTFSSAQLGEEVAIVVPSRVVCARCDGGGCDACGRSGAIRIDREESERTAYFVLPTEAGDGSFRVRLVRPLGDDAGLEQLTVDVHLLPAPPTTALALAASTALAQRPIEMRSVMIGIGVVIATLLAILAGLR